jgi:hypothetical protein
MQVSSTHDFARIYRAVLTCKRYAHLGVKWELTKVISASPRHQSTFDVVQLYGYVY